MLFSLFSPFRFYLVLQPDAGVQEPDATVDDDTYDTGGAYYYVQPADDDQE